jgi:hypothetical protein
MFELLAVGRRGNDLSAQLTVGARKNYLRSLLGDNLVAGLLKPAATCLSFLLLVFLAFRLLLEFLIMGCMTPWLEGSRAVAAQAAYGPGEEIRNRQVAASDSGA